MSRYHKQAIIEFYERNVVQHGDNIGAVGWGSRESQRRRFQALAEVAELKDSVILDVGCGLGDFYGYLRETGHDVKYVGYDLSPKMIAAAQIKYPHVVFEVKDLLEEKVDATFDYVFASGTFNLRVKDSDRIVQEMIGRMYELCTRGVAFNMMSTYADFFNDTEYYGHPGEVFKYCMSITRRVVLRHDYMPHDFTIWMYRETSVGL